MSAEETKLMVELKQKYREMKGTWPRGPKANDAAWLTQQLSTPAAETARAATAAAHDSTPELGAGNKRRRPHDLVVAPEQEDQTDATDDRRRTAGQQQASINTGACGYNRPCAHQICR